MPSNSHFETDYSISYLARPKFLFPILNIFEEYAEKYNNSSGITYEDNGDGYETRTTLIITNCPKEDSGLRKEVNQAYEDIMKKYFYNGDDFTKDQELAIKIPTLEINTKIHKKTIL